MKKRSFFIIFILFLSLIAGKNTFAKTEVKTPNVEAPIIQEVKQKEGVFISRPIIKGKVEKGNNVLIYINGSFVGFAQVYKNESGLNDFVYKMSKYLPIGHFNVFALAQDKETLVLSPYSNDELFFSESLPAPTLLKTIENKKGNAIQGVTHSGTKVNLFINNNLVSSTEILNHNSGVAAFTIQIPENLPKGRYEISAVAEDEKGEKSIISNSLIHQVSERIPSPILIDIIKKEKKNIITGLIKNGLEYEVYVDGELVSREKAKDHESGTANFSYELKASSKKQEVYTKSVDSDERKSFSSNVLVIDAREMTKIVKPKVNTKPIVKGIDNQVEKKKDTSVEIKKESKDKEEQKEKKEEIVKELSPEEEKTNDLEKATSSDEAGEIQSNISKEGEKKTKLNKNIIIFVLFIISVIMWMIWVNQELIKEKQEEEEKKAQEEENQKS